MLIILAELDLQIPSPLPPYSFGTLLFSTRTYLSSKKVRLYAPMKKSLCKQSSQTKYLSLFSPS